MLIPTIRNLFSNNILNLGLATVAISLTANSASAVTLSDSGVAMPGFSVSGAAGRSYDGPTYDFFRPFQGLTTNELLSMTAFTGQAGGSKLTVHLLAEAACYDGRIAGKANKFGVVDSGGNFTSIIDSASAAPGAMGMIAQGENQSFTFALQSPEALFSADATKNSDSAVHIVGAEVTKNTTITINNPLTRASAPIQFQLFAGDIVLFIEDLKASGNVASLGMIPNFGDFDYNDMVVVVRQSQVPEPASMALLSAGLLGLRRRRRA